MVVHSKLKEKIQSNEEGRLCSRCQEFTQWEGFYYKSQGHNQRDNICIRCRGVKNRENVTRKCVTCYIHKPPDQYPKSNARSCIDCTQIKQLQRLEKDKERRQKLLDKKVKQREDYLEQIKALEQEIYDLQVNSKPLSPKSSDDDVKEDPTPPSSDQEPTPELIPIPNKITNNNLEFLRSRPLPSVLTFQL